MATVKSVIVPEVSTALTAAYTNSTGSNATLKAINADGIGDPSVWTVTASAASEWTYFGTPNPTFIGPSSTTAGNTAPIAVQLSADRVLLLWTPANIHSGAGNDYLGGTVLHSQIVEYTGTVYRAGPIVNVSLPFAYFNSQTVGMWTSPDSMGSANSQACARAIALTSTKVALVLRYSSGFHLLRLNISGNSVDQANVVNFALSGATAFNSTSAFAFDVAPVLDNTNKVIVGGSNGTNWSLQSYNIPDSGAITVDSSLFNTGLAHTTFSFAMAPLSATATGTTSTYIVAANTSTGVTISLQHFSFNSSTSAFAAVGTAVTTTATNTTGMAARCLSSDATANAVVAFINTGSTNQMQFVRQTSLTQAANAVSPVTLSSSATRGLKMSFSWGTARAVFLSEVNGLVVYDNTGTATALISSTESNTTSASQTYWYPFNTRPLYTIFDTTPTFVGRVPQFMSRTAITSATSVGTATFTGNYFPHGFPYNGHFSWSDKAQCWMVGQGGRVYAVSDAGVVLNELNLYNIYPAISTNSIYLSVKQLEVTSSGKILFTTDTQGSHASNYYGLYWNSLTTQTYGFALNPVTSPANLISASLISVPTLFSYHVALDLVAYTDFSGIERALGLYFNSATNGYIAAIRFDGGQWLAAGNTSVTNAAVSSAYQFGARPNFCLIQDVPADSAYQTGLWRIIGAPGTNSQSNFSYQAISTTSVSDPSITSAATATIINQTVAAVYPAIKFCGSPSTACVAFYDTNALVGRYYFSINGRMVNPLLGFTIAGANTMQFMNIVSTKYGFVISPCSTSTSAVGQSVYVFDTVTTPYGPKYTLTANSGNGWTTVFRSGQCKLNVFGNNVNTQYTVSGPDSAQLHVTISSLTNDFHITSVAGQTVGTGTNNSYRNTDVYMVPDGYSVKLKSTLPGSLAALLTVVEDV